MTNVDRCIDRAAILRLCNDIEDIACDISQQTMDDIVSAESRMIFDKAKEISAKITAPPKTNSDRIRQMTDEELAEFLLESRSRCKMCKKQDEICEGAYHECWNGIYDWLKREASEDAAD